MGISFKERGKQNVNIYFYIDTITYRLSLRMARTTSINNFQRNTIGVTHCMQTLYKCLFL